MNIRDPQKCYVEFELIKTMHTQGIISSSPVVSQITKDGSHDIIVTTESHYIQIFESNKDTKPFVSIEFEDVSFSLPPILYDCDDDGVNDIITIDDKGNIRCIKLNNEFTYVYEYFLQIPSFQLPDDITSLQVSSHPFIKMPPIPLDNRGYTYINSTNEWFEQNLEFGIRKEGIQHNQFNPSGTPYEDTMDPLTEEMEDNEGESIYSEEEETIEEELYNYMKDNRYITQDSIKELYSTIYHTVQQNKNFNIFVHNKTFHLIPQVLASPVVIRPISAEDHTLLIFPVTYSKTDDLLIICALICYDLSIKQFLWVRLLDLTFGQDIDGASLFASPTIIDFDLDGSPEIIVGTASGLLYILNLDGSNQPHWPINTGRILSQITVENLGNEMNIIFGTKEGGVFMYDAEGDLVWSRFLYGPILMPIIVADINDDHVLDIVVSTSLGDVHVFRGIDGKVVKGFPLKVPGHINYPLTIAKLTSTKGLDIIIPCQDKYIYIYNSISGCVRRIYINDIVSGQVLVGDFENTNHINLLVTTHSGSLFIYRVRPVENTKGIMDYSLLNQWIPVNQGLNGMIYQYNYRGVYFTSKSVMDVSGASFSVTFTIVDQSDDYKTTPNNHGNSKSYTILISYGSIVIFRKVYTTTGTYTVALTLPQEGSFLLDVTLLTEHYHYSHDSISIQYNTSFYYYIQGLLLLPLLLLYLYILFTKVLDTPLPL
ncbi:hypothetical protein WA158_008030 [Blastocystis sp. Blastoise]